jgi:hypothetical protein
MRDGCGDEWWIVFHTNGWAAIKGLAHESKAWFKGRSNLSSILQAQFPSELSGFVSEPAFRWDDTSFGYYYLPSTPEWKRANDTTTYSADDAGDCELLNHLVGGPSDYGKFASDYFETEVPTDIVTDVFNHAPITQAIISTLNPSIKLEDIEDELYAEIGYPR